jgi:hypothetical protein
MEWALNSASMALFLVFLNSVSYHRVADAIKSNIITNIMNMINNYINNTLHNI